MIDLRSLDFFVQAEDGIRDLYVTGVQTCALPIFLRGGGPGLGPAHRWPGAPRLGAGPPGRAGRRLRGSGAGVGGGCARRPGGRGGAAARRHRGFPAQRLLSPWPAGGPDDGRHVRGPAPAAAASLMRLEGRHVTRYTYLSPISETQMEFRLRPLE